MSGVGHSFALMSGIGRKTLLMSGGGITPFMGPKYGLYEMTYLPQICGSHVCGSPAN